MRNRWGTTRRAAARVALGGWVALAVGCGAVDDAGLAGEFPDAAAGDVFAPDASADAVPGADAREQDALVPDVGPADDEVTSDASEPDVRTLSLKDDDQFLVPGPVAERREIALSGTHVAWVERAAPGEPERLMLWPLDGFSEPIDLGAPYLTNPRQLVLTESWLFYVDDRYGDPDVFGVRLVDGADVAVVTRPGAQEHPTADGEVVAWQDCRLCLEGQPAVPALYTRDMAGGGEARLTASGQPERRPAFGTLGNGSVSLGWVAGETAVAALVDEGPNAWEVDLGVEAVALASGKLVWRASKAIINPDSMIPSDLFVTDALTGATASLSVHGHLEPGLDVAPSASGSRVAWLESVPGTTPGLRRVRMVDVATGGPATIETVVQMVGLTQARLGPGHLAFTAPRADNGGMSDLWVLPL